MAATRAKPTKIERIGNRLIFPPQVLLKWQSFFYQRGEVARAQRDHLVVEVELRVVQEAAAGSAALAEPDVGAGALREHVGEVLAAHRRRRIGDHVAFAEDALAD